MSTPAVGVKAPSNPPAAAVDHLLGSGRPGNEQVPSPRRSPGATSWKAFGTRVNLVVGDRDRLELAATLARELLSEVRRRCDAGRPGSDLAFANQAAGAWVTVDPLLLGAVRATVRVARATGGLGGAPGSAEVGTDRSGRVRVPAGGHLDLGTTLRAYAADLVATSVAERVGTPLIVGVGGDVAVGRVPGNPQQWRVTLSEIDHSPDGEPVLLEAGGLATVRLPASQHGETTHLLDPRSGGRLDPVWRSVTVCAASCLDAHAAASAAILMGDLAPAWLWEHGLAARLIGIDSLTLRVAGWPDPA